MQIALLQFRNISKQKYWTENCRKRSYFFPSCLLKLQTRIVVNWILDKKFAPVSSPVRERDRDRDREIRDRIIKNSIYPLSMHSVRSQANIFSAKCPRWRLVNKIFAFSSLVGTHFIVAVSIINQGPKKFFELIMSHS